MSREGEARRPALLEPPKRSPRSSLLPTVSRPCCLPCLSAVCRSAATASPPVRAAAAHSTACQGRAGGEAEEWGRACLGLDTLCYTWPAARRQRRKKGVKGLDFGLYIIHVLFGNYDLYDFRNLSGQAARRGRDLYFPRYRLDSQAECEEFIGALRYLLERVPLTCDLDGLLSRWHWFAEWSIGCVGILRDWMVDTVAGVFEEGGTTLTIKALEQYALQPDQRVRMEMEARAGERKVEEGKARSQQQLQELLGKTVKASPSIPLQAGNGQRSWTH